MDLRPRLIEGAPLDLSASPTSLLGALYEARRAHGGGAPILQDDAQPALSYDRLVQAAWALGGQIARFTAPRERVGVLLPTCAPAVVTVFATGAFGRVPALLNFTAGATKIRAACDLAAVRSVITSRRFAKTAGLEPLLDRLSGRVSVVFLEDLRDAVSVVDKAVAGLRAAMRRRPFGAPTAEDAAVILFTSGTTGAPKGVALSHANLIANIAQCRAHIPFGTSLVFFNALPLFHAFGLTAGALLPILGGMRTVLHPSPLDHERIPKLIEKTGASVLVSTDTFARFYARAATPHALAGLRYAVLGGEKVQPATLALFAEKSTARVLQGYGATECGPVVAVNQPEADRPDTVGRLLPGMQARFDPVAGVNAGLQLKVRGPNVMSGYLDAALGGAVRASPEDWFDTGDLACVDPDGFITVTGRLKRFAKIGAEMVSLSAVEDHAAALWPQARHAALAVRHADTGETVALVTEQKGADRAALAAWGRAHGASDLETPHLVFTMRKLPLLPTGKPDLDRLRRMVDRRMARARKRGRQSNTAPGAVGRTPST